MKLWGMTTFFNPSGYATKLANYRKFRVRSRAQGLPLVAVELAFDSSPFVLRPGVDAEILVQRRSSGTMWQKERLLNIALAHLPPECDRVCWIDADVLILEDDWVARSSRALGKFAVLQPFQRAVRLRRGEPRPGRRRRAPPPTTDPVQLRRRLSYCAGIAYDPPLYNAITGYAWCARRSILDEVGFFDRCITGGADRELALAVTFAPGTIPEEHIRIYHRPLRKALRAWHERIYPAVNGNVTFLPFTAHHLWHGDRLDRQYRARHTILEQFEFSPMKDIRIGRDDCWEWTTKKSGMISAVADYFAARREDG